MSDKIVQFPTDFVPVEPPPSASDIEQVKFALAVIQDELMVLSTRITQLTRVVQKHMTERGK